MVADGATGLQNLKSELRAGERPARASQAVKLTIELRQRLRLWAAFLDVEISALVEEAVAARLDALDHERDRQGLPPLPRPPSESEIARGTRARRRV